MDREPAFSAYVAARRAKLFRTACLLCGDPHRAEDVVQDALARLYANWPRVSAPTTSRGTSAGSWSTATTATAGGPGAARRPRRSVELPLEPGLAPEDADAIWAAIRGLPPGQRKVVVLRHIWDRSVEETAADLGISPGTVKSQTSDALAALRRALHVRVRPLALRPGPGPRRPRVRGAGGPGAQVPPSGPGVLSMRRTLAAAAWPGSQHWPPAAGDTSTPRADPTVTEAPPSGSPSATVPAGVEATRPRGRGGRPLAAAVAGRRLGCAARTRAGARRARDSRATSAPCRCGRSRPRKASGKRDGDDARAASTRHWGRDLGTRRPAGASPRRRTRDDGLGGGPGRQPVVRRPTPRR